MKHSIKKIFNNLNIYLYFILFLSLITLLVVIEQDLSMKKIDNLNNQKRIISNLTKLQKKDIELALIQFNGKSTQLLNDTQKLVNIYQYNITQKYILNTSKEYYNDLSKLKKLTKEFNNSANDYYTKYTDKTINSEQEELNKQKLQSSRHTLNTHINSIIFKEIQYNKIKFLFLQKLAILSFIIIIILALWFKKQLKLIYKDILFLYSIEQGKKNHEIFSEEIDAISLRMKRKTVTADNPTMIDKVTQINNKKGMMNSYTEKKDLKKDNTISITIFEIDNFSKANKAFSQESIQMILKKVAFTISLHEQPIDIIARTDYNQFTIILSRLTKELAFKDIETIKNSVSELKFNIPNSEITNITISGGFMVKPSQMHIEESLKITRLALEHAKNNGGNRISKEKEIITINI